MGTGFSCSWNRPVPGVAEPQPIFAGDRAQGQGEDRLQNAYRYFAVAYLHQMNGRDELTKKYLAKAVENDPDSVYLNRKMVLLLNKLKEYEESLTYARKCRDLEPDNLSHQVLLAEVYSLSGDDNSAREEYNKILEKDPDQSRIRLVLTTILIKNRQFAEAKSQLEQLILAKPDMVIAHYYMGRINLELEDYEAAESAYNEALKFNPKMEPALFDLGSLYQMRQKYQEAARIYENLLGFYPSNVIVRERLINIYFQIGQEKKADVHMGTLKEQAKPGEPGRQALGLIYLRHGRLDESIEELDLIVSAWPDDDKSRYYLAAAHEERGDKEKALYHFGRIWPESEYFTKTRMHMAYILGSQGKHDESIALLKKTIAVKNDEIELYLMLASELENQKSYEEGVRVIKKGLLVDEKNVDLLFRLGVVLDKMGKNEESLEEMRKILEIDPEHSDALNYIGYTYADQGIRLDEARDLIERALKIKPDSGYIVDSLGWVYYQEGRYEEALKHLEKAAVLVPDDPTVAEHLGDVYGKLNRFEESLEMYQKALSLDHSDPQKINGRINEVKKMLQEGEGE